MSRSPVARTRQLGRPQQRPLLLRRQRARRRLRQRLALEVRGPQAEKPVEVIDRRERQVHRRRLPTTIDLQMPLEVPRRVIAPPRVADRERRLGSSGQPGSIRADMLTVGIPCPGRQRRPLQIRQIPRDRGVEVADRRLVLVSRPDFRRCEAATTGLVDEDPDGTVL